MGSKKLGGEKKASEKQFKQSVGRIEAAAHSTHRTTPVAVIAKGRAPILPEVKNTASVPQENAVSSVKSTDPSGSSTRGRYMATFTQRKTDKSGSTSYAMPGVRSSVYFNKGIFAGAPPATIEIVSDVPFAEPGAVKVATPKAPKETPEQKTERLAAAKAARAAMTPKQKADARIATAKAALEAAEKAATKVIE